MHQLLGLDSMSSSIATWPRQKLLDQPLAIGNDKIQVVSASTPVSRQCQLALTWGYQQ
jgi:hypothetical protein